MNLRQYSIEQLEGEIKRRKELVIPEQVENPDLSELRKSCSIYIKNVLVGISDSDDKHYIFEEALKAIYGNDIFDWLKEVR